MLLPKHTITITGTLLLSAALNMQTAWAGDFNSATLVEARGDVFKRGFVDWNREMWEDPMPAKKGDSLKEGMQLGTGDKSWAQLAWTNVTARAWANSIYAVAPNQRLVYLLGGEMLYHLDKHRKDKAPYYVWTKLVQARVRGTTILFQNTANSTRISVLEGSVDVLNRLDRSVVRITPGVVYEVKDLSAGAGIGATGGAAGASAAALNQNNVTLSGAAPVQLFQTSKTLTSIYALNPQAALNHPLLGSFPAALSSLPLVEKTLVPLVSKLDGLINGLTGGLGGLTSGLTNGLTGGLTEGLTGGLTGVTEGLTGGLTEGLTSGLNGNLADVTGGLTNGLTGGISKNLGHINWANGLPVALSSSQTNSLNESVMAGAQVLSVPRSLAYKIGPLAGTVFTLPRDAVSYFPPSGVIGVGESQETGPFVQPLISSVLVPSGSLISKAPSLPASKSILSSKLSPLLASATEGSSRSVLKNLHDLQPSKTLIGSVSGTGVLDISSLSGRLGSATSGLASLASLGSITPSFSTSSFSVGSLGGASILPGGGTGGGLVGGAVGGLGGTVGGLGGAVGGTVGGTVGGAIGGLGGTVGGLGGTVGGLLGGGSGGGGLLGGLGGGLGGLLGH